MQTVGNSKVCYSRDVSLRLLNHYRFKICFDFCVRCCLGKNRSYILFLLLSEIEV